MDTNNPLNSKQYYDSISGEYAFVRNQRGIYLDKVDSLIIKDFYKKSTKMLDVGAGDGLRGLKIFKNIEADTIYLVEESDKMIRNVERLGGVNVFVGPIQQFHSQEKFDLILCLWNVLGHINTFQDRASILKTLRDLLAINGTIVIDFNNRYNYRQYGALGVIRNIIVSLLKKEAGWFGLKNKDGSVHGKVYIHNYFEIKMLISQAGLRVESLRVIDYSSGKIQNNLFQGQYLFYLKNNITRLGQHQS